MSLSLASAHTRFWIAVAAAEHVRRGRAEGFMQVCHGKRGPLTRISPGDGVAYYSPSEHFGANAKYRCFTALGIVCEGLPYEVDMGGGFKPSRRDVDWLPIRETPIVSLLDKLAFSAGKRNWGQALRFGLVEVVLRDFELLRERMTYSLPNEPCIDGVRRDTLTQWKQVHEG